MTAVMVVAEHDRGTLAPATLEAMTAARSVAAAIGVEVHALTIGADGDDLAADLGAHGATVVHQAHHDVLSDYGPEAWGDVVAQAVRTIEPVMIVATGTDRGNEIVANAAARLDLPFAANCVELEVDGDRLGLTRLRWGGSLLERAAMGGGVHLVTVAHHHFDVAPASVPQEPVVTDLDVSIAPALARSVVVDRIEREAGATLATSPVVVGGGRGVGSAEAFAPLEELAVALGGVVGCSRAVTNNGWRNHADQVGQTGTRIAPEVYFACGISGAIQHWVGAMASKQIIAINTDREANMVTKANYAVIGDLHEVVPAITAEIERRRA
ncbi:MAG: electron transfer flavoprotein subunit alpha/FixB family protein [Acidimicrobiia bacterium]|nr:electron transfer flavoprotein subunit alpha/FixB family protein [Acidimicrobiia bacterium]